MAQRAASKYSLRPRLVDLNILPAEYLRPAITSTHLLFFFLILAGAYLSYFFAQEQLSRMEEISYLQGRLQKAQQAAAQLKAQEPEGNRLRGLLDEAQKKLQPLEKDRQALALRQVRWSQILNIIQRAASADITLDSIAQGGSQVTLKGSAGSYVSATQYGDRLRESNLFSSVSIQLISLASGPSTGATLPPPPPGTPLPIPIPTPIPPITFTPAVPLTPTPTPRPTPTTTPISPLVLTPTSTPTSLRTPTPIFTPTRTSTPTASPTPTPAFDYIVLKKERTAYPGPDDLNNVIRGRVINLIGEPVPGLKFRLSTCCPAWSAEYPRSLDPSSNGTFEFTVNRGNFILEITGQRAQQVTDLSTDVFSFKGYHVWEVVFQTTFGPPFPTPTPIPTPTESSTPTPALGTTSLLNLRDYTPPLMVGYNPPLLARLISLPGEGNRALNAAVSFIIVLTTKPGGGS
ncbi:MAG: PilN domain-containing protein [Chloroflexi bacterium]|nr:PilN domain-containing protein [Chloroflexota bacterium]